MIKEKIKSREKIFGTHINMGNLWIADVFGMCGYDFVWIDTEHSPIELSALLECVTVLKAHGTAVFIRTQINDFNHTKRILEMGADGIIFPMVETAEQADECMKYTLYPPEGIRGFGPNRAIAYGLKDTDEYVKNQGNLCRFVQIESPKTVENLEEILKNPYIDGFIFGPCDMAFNCGVGPDASNEGSLDMIKTAIGLLKKHKKYIGVSIGATDRETQKFWLDMGVDMISAGGDIGFIAESALKNAEQLFRLVK